MPDYPIHAPIIASAFPNTNARPINASMVVAQAMAAHDPEIGFVEVPVIWGTPMSMLGHWKSAPKIWLAMGEASDRLRLECLAHNQRRAIPDSLGELPDALEILPGQPNLVNPAPVAQFAASLTAAGFPTALSTHAGRYLCEELFYALLHHQTKVWPSPPLVHFLHLPQFGLPVMTAAGTPSATEYVDLPYLGRLATVLGSLLRASSATWLHV